MIQELMDEVYTYWNSPEGESLDRQGIRLWTQENLSEKHLRALQIGNLNYQVENGGFMQWYDNGYAELDIDDLINFLSSVEGEKVKKVRDILEHFREDLQELERIQVRGKKELMQTRVLYEYADLIIDNLVYTILQSTSNFDSQYYEINDSFLNELEENYFNK